MRLPWVRRRVEASYTGYYAASDGHIMGPDRNHSGEFYISNNYNVGPRNSGRFFLSDAPIAGVRFVFDTHKPDGHLDYDMTATGHFYGPEQDLPWFR